MLGRTPPPPNRQGDEPTGLRHEVNKPRKSKCKKINNNNISFTDYRR
jgi:hypothetical protein